ncbi:DUF4124 domain-containing protein [Luteimonas sp. A478]
MSRALLLLAALLAASSAAAAPATIYQCTEPDGTITVQNSPCPEGQPQRIRIVDVPPPVTLQPPHVQPRTLKPTALPQLHAASAAAPEELVERGPPPALFHCTRYDNTRYLQESEEPETNCRPMETVGIGGVPGIGAGMACERVRDECDPVPDEALCQAWETRLRETEFRWQFSTDRRDSRALRSEYEQLSAIYAASTCAADD